LKLKKKDWQGNNRRENIFKNSKKIQKKKGQHLKAQNAQWGVLREEIK
jgi:hypothetical protein